MRSSKTFSLGFYHFHGVLDTRGGPAYVRLAFGRGLLVTASDPLSIDFAGRTDPLGQTAFTGVHDVVCWWFALSTIKCLRTVQGTMREALYVLGVAGGSHHSRALWAASACLVSGCK